MLEQAVYEITRKELQPLKRLDNNMSIRPAKILTLVPLVTCYLLLVTSTAFAQQDVLLSPPEPGNSQIMKASTGAPFNPGWNYFTVGFDGCTTLTVLNELQADGGSALNVDAIFTKEFLNWQSYTFQSPQQKKLGSNDVIAFNSNQKFFLQIDQNTCQSPNSQRQAQIDKVREGQTAKQNLLDQVKEMPVDLWTKLTNLLNQDGVPSQPAVNNNQNLDSLNITGKTTVNDLGITGKVTAGLLTINGFNNTFASLDTLSDDLYLQDQGLGGVNILNGKFTIDKNGDVKILKLNIDDSDSSSSSIGGGKITAGSTFVTVETTSVTSKSRIFVTPTSETGGEVLIVKYKNAGSGFTVTIQNSQTSDITFDWWVVN